MATAANWLGFQANFENVEDKTSESSFELLQEGFYKAEVKKVIKSVIGANDKPALTITLELEEGKKEIVHNLFLPENGDEQTAIDFKLQNLRNFFTRALYSKLTKEEYSQLGSEEVNTALTKMQTSTKGAAQFEGAKVLVDLRQEPFFATDKETKALKFTDVNFTSVIDSMPKKLLNMVNNLEKKGIEITKMPVTLFSNKIAACGFGFYNDYNEGIGLKNSKTYEFVQAHLNTTNHSSNETENATKTIPTF